MVNDKLGPSGLTYRLPYDGIKYNKLGPSALTYYIFYLAILLYIDKLGPSALTYLYTSKYKLIS